MKTYTQLLLMVIFLSTFACNSSSSDPTKTSKTDEVVELMEHAKKMEKPTDGMFIHLSSGPDDPQRVLMAFNMAKLMSKDKDVLMYIDIKGVYTVLKNADDITFNEFPPLSELLEELKNSSAKITVCPTCLKAAGKTSDDLLDFVELASKDRFYGFTQGRIISIDY